MAEAEGGTGDLDLTESWSWRDHIVIATCWAPHADIASFLIDRGAQHHIFSAVALGLADEVRSIVGLEEHLQPLAVVPIGRPARPLGPSRREPVAARAHLDRFGQPFGVSRSPGS